MKITEIGYHPAYDPEKERIKFLQARQEQRLGKVFAMAKGELKRMAGMEFRADGTVDVMALDKALSGQSVERRMRLRSMLFELGAIPA
jgi:RecA/RadA recombinase